MGQDKALVPLRGKPMLAHVIEHTSDLGQAMTILITNRPDDHAIFKLLMYGDVLPNQGSLGGIYSALHYSPTETILAVSCDAPFVSADLLRYLLSLRGVDGAEYDVIVPRVEGYPEGLQAIYKKTCLTPIRSRIAAGKLNVIGFYPDVKVRYVDEAEYAPYDPRRLSFFNVNTPEELAEADRLAAQ